MESQKQHYINGLLNTILKLNNIQHSLFKIIIKGLYIFADVKLH